MPMPVRNELWIFLWSICGGIALGFVFDIFRIKRRIMKTGKILISIEDLLYWLFAAVLFFLTLYLSNEGQMRGFSIIGSILGAVFYLSAISPAVLRVSSAVIAAIKKSILFLIRVVMWPVNLLVKLLRPILILIGKVIGLGTKKCANTANAVSSNTKSLCKNTASKVKKKFRKKSIKVDK